MRAIKVAVLEVFAVLLEVQKKSRAGVTCSGRFLPEDSQNARQSRAGT